MNGVEKEEIIIRGMARVMFASVWMDWQEEYGDMNLSGVDGYYAAPETPDYVLLEARKRAGHLEMLNGRGDMPEHLFMLALQAARADAIEELGIDDDADPSLEAAIDRRFNDEEYLESFGSDLGLEMMGHGVSWFDDHAEFDLKVPYSEYTYFDLDDESYPIPVKEDA